jgi:hypothetical protein
MDPSMILSRTKVDQGKNISSLVMTNCAEVVLEKNNARKRMLQRETRINYGGY